MNKIIDPTLVPNAGPLGVGFVYVDPDSGRTFVHSRVEQVTILARDHRIANSYPIGSDFRQWVIDNICRSTPGHICYNEEVPSLTQRAVNMTKALLESAAGGFKTATPEQVQQRLTICETSGPNGTACEYFKGLNGMFGVYCGRCGCSKVKMHLKSSVCPLNKWPAL
jgi:hypothetical protein